jgi:hypothetical protein
MSSSDKTKELLEQVLLQLYSEQAQGKKATNGSYLIAHDEQFLGKINDNAYDNESILNDYGPYGSEYSNTSIFNPYSPYGSEYGAFSVSNPYCSTPPKLFINGNFQGHVSVNQYVQQRIPTEAFLYTLKNNIQALLSGRIIKSESQARQLSNDSYIEAGDGTFLGKLNPNRFDNESIFNSFGPYGNKFSQLSIFNKFSNYGSQFSMLSPFNNFSNNPPKLYANGKFVAYLTTNQFLNPRLHPDELLDWAEKNVRKYR